MAALRLPLAFILLTAFTLAGCSSSNDSRGGDGGDGSDADNGGNGGGSSESGFTLHVGDKWVHKTVGGGFDSTTTAEVKAIEDHGGTQAYRVEGDVSNTAQGTTSTADSTTWTRVSDHATLEVQTTTQVSYMGYSSDSSSTTVFDPPCEGPDWPLSVGQSWETSCTSTTTVNGQSSTVTTTSTSTVEARESVTVPAGTFTAYRIVSSSGGTSSTAWVAADACGLVKSTATVQGQTVTTELQSYDC